MPAYFYDPYLYKLHKLKGGTFNSYSDKTYLPLTDQQIVKHIHGEQLIGIYPLLQDNTTCFIAADFDKHEWQTECLAFIRNCKKNGIPAYLERSRSGKGGHVWIFIEKSYPAIKIRKIISTLLEQSGIFSVFDKNSSFDRLFPNQDFHSGKGLGNLIAMPLYKPAVELGNSCFLDTKSEALMPYSDQWAFLSAIEKVSCHHLDQLHQAFSGNTNASLSNHSVNGKLQITLSNNIRLNRSSITLELASFLKEELNFSNSEFFVKKKSGRNTWGTQRFFKCIEETEHAVTVPRGFIGKLLRFCRQQKIEFEFLDLRHKRGAVKFDSTISLRPYQYPAVEAAKQKNFGIISAPPGSGKTLIGLKIIADNQQPSLIIVHRKQLMDQWIERIVTFLQIPKKEIGTIGQGKPKPGKLITVAMIQSLDKFLELPENNEFSKAFGTILIDECHHIPAETFRNTISKLEPYYQYGLTATPFRKGNDEKLIFISLGEIIAEIKTNDIENYKRPRIVISNTSFQVPFNPKTDPFETLSKMLIHDSARNKQILKDVTTQLQQSRKAVILTERKEHIEALNQFLKQSFETITLSGEDSETSRKAKWKLLDEGNYQALITTGQFFGEGTDLQNASCLFLAYPFSFKGKLIQYIGRVQRAEITPIIFDYRDIQIDYLNRLFLKRNKHYRHFDRQDTLFAELENIQETSKIVTINKPIKVLIDQLDFRYGAAAFTFSVPEVKAELEFEIENDDLHPEFDVLKYFFTKALKSKYIDVSIFAEFENGVLVSQSATSTAIEKINQEIIESVKFRFLEKDVLGKRYLPDTEETLLDFHGVLETPNHQSVYASEDDLLQNLLSNKNCKHYKHLRFLASKHDDTAMKLRFVLNPFSFVFLLTGHEQFHLVLETYDTEEATYIWHFEKHTQILKQKLKDIDQDLSVIRNMGRQFFLESNPDHFSRLIHDYADERKGFILWKSLLEERLM